MESKAIGANGWLVCHPSKVINQNTRNGGTGARSLALAEEAALGESLAEVISPSGKIGVRIRFEVPEGDEMRTAKLHTKPRYALIDVSLSREVLRIAANILGIGILVDTDVIDLHRCGEGEMV